jgi:hypothetical protein
MTDPVPEKKNPAKSWTVQGIVVVIVGAVAVIQAGLVPALDGLAAANATPGDAPLIVTTALESINTLAVTMGEVAIALGGVWALIGRSRAKSPLGVGGKS